jgi:hypothetical protein
MGVAGVDLRVLQHSVDRIRLAVGPVLESHAAALMHSCSRIQLLLLTIL